MSWLYKHQTGMLAGFAGAAFAMCLSALIHTAIWGYPVPKAAYFTCTIIYVIAAPLYLILWYHSRLCAANANPSRYLHRRRPGNLMSAEDPELLRNMMRARPMADAQASPTTPPRERARWVPPPAPASNPYMPRPVQQVAPHPPAARFSTPAPPATNRMPPLGPRLPPNAMPHGPFGSAGSRASAPPANFARLAGVIAEQAVPPAAEQPPPRAPAAMRPSALPRLRSAEPTGSVPNKVENAAPVHTGARGGTPVERHGAWPVGREPRLL